MASVILKVNAARIIILKAKTGKDIVKKLTLKPQPDDELQSIPEADWNCFKNLPMVKKMIRNSDIVIMNQDAIEEEDTIVDIKALEKKLKGDILVKGREAVDEEISNALESGNIDEVLERYPVLSDAINKMVESAVAAKTSDKTIEDELVINEPVVDEIACVGDLVSSLDGKGEDEIKAALREYAASKYDMKLGNAGIPKMIEMIESKESE